MTTRRRFLALLGQVGGAAAVQGALGALGLGEARADEPFAPTRTERARGRKVLVLGGSIRRGTRVVDTDGETQVSGGAAMKAAA
jgi:hypothetical protein